MKRYQLLLLLLLIFVAAKAQEPSYLFTQLRTGNGLVSNEVMGVQQDSAGYIWIATLSGIQRYDGKRFITFQHNDDDRRSIPNDRIHWIELDKKNRLWVLFNESQVGWINTSDLSFHNVPVNTSYGTQSSSASNMYMDEDDHVMLLLYGTGVFTYDEKSRTFDTKNVPFKIPAGWHVTGCFQNKKDKNYWLGCDSGLVKYNPQTQLMSYRNHNAEHEPVIDAYADVLNNGFAYLDAKGRFWLFSWAVNGRPFLYSYDLLTHVKKEWEDGLFGKLRIYHELNWLGEMKDGNLWISGTNLFCRLNEITQTFEPVKSSTATEFSILYDAVRNLYEDREHNIWASTNKGLYRFNPPGQIVNTYYNRVAGRDTFFTPDVQHIYQTSDNNILVATWGNGIFAYDNNFNPVKLDYIEAGKKLGEGLTWSILERPNGDVWRGNQDGYIYIYHKDKNKSERIQPEELEHSTIRQMVQDKKGNIWFGLQRGKIGKWDAVTQQFSLLQNLKSRVLKMYADESGFIWACTLNNGVYKVNAGTGEISEHYTNDGPPGKKLLNAGAYDIIKYNDSILVIVSGQLNLLNTHSNRITYFTTKDGLGPAAVVSVVKDRNDILWLATESGLSSVNLSKKLVTFYNERDGMQSVSFNEAAGGALRDGRVVFGGSHEFIVLDPSRIAKNDLLNPPTVKITGFSVMNKSMSIDSLSKLKQIELEYDQNSLVIEFSTLTYQDNYGIYYRMENLQEGWQITPSTNQAVFSYLPPGNYTFKVRCINGNGVYSKEITELKIRIRAPFWRTWWFYGLLILLIGLLIYWLDRLRTNRKAVIQKMRSDIAGNLHNDVNTGLNNINILSEIARMKADREPERSIEYIEQINSKSHEMIIAMDDMLWSIDPVNDNMKKTVDRMKEYIDSLKNRHNVKIDLTVEEKIENLSLNMKLRHESFQLFKLAIKGLVDIGAGNCQLYMGFDKPNLLFSIQFDTTDCDMQQLNNMLQRPDMKQRLEAIKGTLSIEVHKSNSVFLIEVPVN